MVFSLIITKVTESMKITSGNPNLKQWKMFIS